MAYRLHSLASQIGEAAAKSSLREYTSGICAAWACAWNGAAAKVRAMICPTAMTNKIICERQNRTFFSANETDHGDERDKKLTPTPNPLIETTVRAANNVVMTPITNAAGIMAKLMRLIKWWPKVRPSASGKINCLQLASIIIYGDCLGKCGRSAKIAYRSNGFVQFFNPQGTIFNRRQMSNYWNDRRQDSCKTTTFGTRGASWWISLDRCPPRTSDKKSHITQMTGFSLSVSYNTNIWNITDHWGLCYPRTKRCQPHSTTKHKQQSLYPWCMPFFFSFFLFLLKIEFDRFKNHTIDWLAVGWIRTLCLAIASTWMTVESRWAP